MKNIKFVIPIVSWQSIVEQYVVQQQTTREIAKQYGVCKYTIEQILKRMNVEMMRAGRNRSTIEENGILYRTCNICKKKLELTKHFSKDASRPFGYAYRCTICDFVKTRKSRYRLSFLTQQEYRAVFDKTDGTCYICNKQFKYHANCHHPDYPTIDHQVPISKDGLDTIDNCFPCCLECNLKKGNK